MAPFSASGPGCGGCRNPDVVAPGAHLQGLRVPGSFVDQSTPPGVLDARFQRGSGTSESAAIVSGAIALVLQKHPDLRARPGQEVPRSPTRSRINGADDKAQGKGRINLADLLDRNQDAGGASQHFDASTGTGSLEQSRGSDHLTLDGIVLNGEIDIFGHPFDARAVADLEAAASSWNRGTWNGNSWSGEQLVRKLVVRQQLERQLLVRQLLVRKLVERQLLVRQQLVGQLLVGGRLAVGQPPGEPPNRGAPRAECSRTRATGTSSYFRVMPDGPAPSVRSCTWMATDKGVATTASLQTRQTRREAGTQSQGSPGRPGPSADRPVASHLLERRKVDRDGADVLTSSRSAGGSATRSIVDLVVRLERGLRRPAGCRRAARGLRCGGHRPGRLRCDDSRCRV